MGNATTRENNEPLGVVAVGASAGGVEALGKFAAGLPPGLPFAVTVVLHLPPGGASVLARIIDRSGPLSAEPAKHGVKLQAGRIYVAVPDRHLLIDNGSLVISNGPTENSYRPAINALFRSAALAYGPRAIGVLMSGVLDDGVVGLAAIRSRGGATIAQEPRDALFPGMPINAIDAGVVGDTVPARDMGNVLMRLAERTVQHNDMQRDTELELENRIAMGTRFTTSFDTEALGPPSGYVCPDCNGSLQALSEGLFRCHVGHAWTAEALLSARDEEVESALWVAVRSLQEKAKLARRMARFAGEGDFHKRYDALALEAERAVDVLQDRLSDIYSDQEARGVG